MTETPELLASVLGRTPGAIGLRDLKQIRCATVRMASQANRALLIYTCGLDSTLYDKADFLEPLRQLALSSAHASIKVLLFDVEPAVRSGNRLIELSRQLTSRVQIRHVPEGHEFHQNAYLCADDMGYVLQPVAQVFAGTADFCAPARARFMRHQFERIWERSSQPLDLISFGRGL